MIHYCFSVEVTFSPCMHQTYHIPSSVRLSASKLHKNAYATILYMFGLKPHPPINKPAIVMALGRQLLVQTGKKLPCQKWAPYKIRGRLYKGRQQWPTQSQPRCF